MRKWSSKQGGRFPGKLLASLLFCALCVSGCYEGWDYDRNGDGKDHPPPKPPPPAIPPFFYILLEEVVLSDAAINDDGCFAEPGLSEFRKSEWAARIGKLAETLAPMAQNFALVQHSIAKDDCGKLTTVRAAAINAKPWAPNPDPAEDPLDRSLVNVRAVFWEGDVEADPPAVVTAKQWVGFATMAKSGRKAKTVNHFILEHAAEGYFHTWLGGMAADDRADGTAIDNVDPSDAGIAKRTATITADAAAVAKWLTEHP